MNRTGEAMRTAHTHGRNGRLTSLICEHCGQRFTRGQHYVCNGHIVSGK